MVIYRDGTRAELSGVTNAAGQTTVDLVKDAPIIADVTASTTSTTNQAVSSSGKSVIEWYADGSSGIAMSFLIRKTIPMAVLSCSSIKRDGVDTQLAAALSANVVKQCAALGDSITAKNVPATMVSCGDQVGTVCEGICRRGTVVTRARVVMLQQSYNCMLTACQTPLDVGSALKLA
jgi:hypothetical protein